MELLKFEPEDFEGPYGDDILFTPYLAAARAQQKFNEWVKDNNLGNEGEAQDE